MNKKFFIILALVLAATLVFAGCGKKEAAKETEAAATVEKVEAAEETKDNAEENTNAAEEKETPAAETAKPEESEQSMAEEFIKENTSVGVAQGGGTVDIEESGDYIAPPQVNIPGEDDASDEPVVLNIELADITYDVYSAMSAAEQEAVMDLFGSTEDFMKWLNYIKTAYEADHPSIEVGGDGVVDLS